MYSIFSPAITPVVMLSTLFTFNSVLDIMVVMFSSTLLSYLDSLTEVETTAVLFNIPNALAFNNALM